MTIKLRDTTQPLLVDRVQFTHQILPQAEVVMQIGDVAVSRLVFLQRRLQRPFHLKGLELNNQPRAPTRTTLVGPTGPPRPSRVVRILPAPAQGLLQLLARSSASLARLVLERRIDKAPCGPPYPQPPRVPLAPKAN